MRLEFKKENGIIGVDLSFSTFEEGATYFIIFLLLLTHFFILGAYYY